MDLDFRELLVKIAREITREELDTMKFLCANIKLPDACFDSKHSTTVFSEALNFFLELEKREHLSDGNLDLLKRLLMNAERHDLASKLESLPAQTSQNSSTSCDTPAEVTATKNNQPREDSWVDNQPKEPADGISCTDEPESAKDGITCTYEPESTKVEQKRQHDDITCTDDPESAKVEQKRMHDDITCTDEPDLAKVKKKAEKKKRKREKRKLRKLSEKATLEEAEGKKGCDDGQGTPAESRGNVVESIPTETRNDFPSLTAGKGSDTPNQTMPTERKKDFPKQSMPARKGNDTPNQTMPTERKKDFPKQSLPARKGNDTPNQTMPTERKKDFPKQSLPARKGNDTPNQTMQTERKKDFPKQSLPAGKGSDIPSQTIPTERKKDFPKQSLPASKGSDTPNQTMPTEKKKDFPKQRLPAGKGSDTPNQTMPTERKKDFPKQSLPAGKGSDIPSQTMPTERKKDFPKQRLPAGKGSDTPNQTMPTERKKDFPKQSLPAGKGSDTPNQTMPTERKKDFPKQSLPAGKGSDIPSQTMPTERKKDFPKQRLPAGKGSDTPNQTMPTERKKDFPKQSLPAGKGSDTPNQTMPTERKKDFPKQSLPAGKGSDIPSQTMPTERKKDFPKQRLPAGKGSDTPNQTMPTERKKDFPKQSLPAGKGSDTPNQTMPTERKKDFPKQSLPAGKGIKHEVAKEEHLDHVYTENTVTPKQSTETLKDSATASSSSAVRPLCILLICNKWQSWGESIPVVNRELCLALARAGHQVACLVLTSTDIEREEARKGNVELITCSQKPGIGNDDLQLLQFHDLESLPCTPDLVVGHGKVTGHAALFYAEKISCTRLHVIHDLPDECLIYDEVIDKQVKEEELAKCADFVAAVGTLLHDKWSVILNQDVIEIIPGLPDHNTRNSISSPQSRFFVPAKFSSPWSSGLNLAVMAVNNTSRRDTLPRKATLMPRNTESKGSIKSAKKILKTYDKSRVELNLNERQETKSQQTLVDLQGATFFLSPARSEAFGVSALDAIAIGIPIVISSRSGLACTICKYFDEKFHSCVKDISSECSGNADDDDEEQDALAWAIPLDKASLLREEVFDQAEELRSEWKKMFTWDKAVQLLQNTISKSGKLSSASSRNIPSSMSRERLPDSIVSLVKGIKLFDKRQKFVLFLSPTEDPPPDTVHLGLVHWAAVFDFDRKSMKTGYLKNCENFLENSGKPACRMLPPPEEDAGKQKHNVVLPGGGIPWLLLQGLPDMDRDIYANLDWIQEILQQIKKRYPYPITFLILWKTTEANKSLCKKLSKILTVAQVSPSWKNAVQVELLSLSDEVDSGLKDIAEEWDVEIRSVNLSEFCRAIYSTAIGYPLYQLDTDFSLPKLKSDGCKSTVVPETLPTSSRWVDSVLELLYTSVGDTPEFDKNDAFHFYRGGKISWYGIEMNYAVERDSSDQLREDIESELKYSGAVFLTLPHQRGTGGTTSARKLLYDFHRRFPCVCLKNANYETYLAIEEIWNFCLLPVLILSDLNDIPGADISDIEALYGNLSSSKISCLILHVVHRQNRAMQSKDDHSQKKPLILAETLTPNERQTFCDVYSAYSHSKKEDLAKLRRTSENELQIPFYYGLVAFGKEFKGLEPFVMDCLEGLDNAQQKAMCFLSMAHHYSQKTIPASALAGVFNLKPRQLHSIDDVLPPKATELLIEDEAGCWRPRHYIIGKEIICQLLTAPYSISNTNWKMNLADKVVEFITYMEEEMSSALLLNRISDENTFKQFSTLVEDIPDNGVIRVFNEAIRAHPANPFFRVHLGRYYSVEMGIDGFDAACKCTDDGILLASNFSSKNVRSQFTQMKGIVYKRQVKNKIERKAPLEDLIPLAEEGVKAFERAVSISTERLEDAFIPQVKMMSDIFKYINCTFEGGIFEYLQSASVHPFIQNGISETSDALESVSDSIHYPELRRNLFNVGGRGKAKNKENLIEHFKKLKKTFKASTASINRQIVLIELELCKEKSRPVSEIAEELIQLLEEALKYDRNINLTMRLWVKVAPHIPVTLIDAESKVATWCNKAKGKSVMPYLYRYIFTCIRILEGGRDKSFEDSRSLAQDDLYKAVSAAKHHGIKHPDRPVVFLGTDHDKGMAQLVIPEESVKLDVRKHRTIPDDYGKKLRRLTGTIINLKGKVGHIKAQGLTISFRADLCQPPLVGASYEAKKVKFYLAFTYFGLDAYNVKIMAD